MKKSTLIIVLAVVVALAMFLNVAVPMAAAPEGSLTIDKDAASFKGGKKKKTAVEFSHANHGDVSCTDCHHKAVQADLDVGKASACNAESCHGPTEKVVDGKKMVDLEDAFHGQCKDCHKKAKEEGKKVEAKCTVCHPK